MLCLLHIQGISRCTLAILSIVSLIFYNQQEYCPNLNTWFLVEGIIGLPFCLLLAFNYVAKCTCVSASEVWVVTHLRVCHWYYFFLILFRAFLLVWYGYGISVILPCEDTFRALVSLGFVLSLLDALIILYLSRKQSPVFVPKEVDMGDV